MGATETWTVGKLLTWTTEYLKKNGSQSPRLDAEVLLAYARDCERIELYTAFTDEPTDEVKTAFRELVRRRAEGTPVAYLVGHKEFYSDRFEVDPHVLIPRPETEHLIVEALDRSKQLREQRGDSQQSLRIADVGTGSGIIAITMAKQLDNCHVTAIDLSAEALAVAKRNATLHAVDGEQLQFVEGDLLTACEAESVFDLILSNPPYVSASEFEQLDKSVRDYEPKPALVAGPEGSEIIVRLLEQAHNRVTTDGFVVLEFSPMLAEKLSSWLSGDWKPPHVSKDLAGHPRIITLQKKN